MASVPAPPPPPPPPPPSGTYPTYRMQQEELARQRAAEQAKELQEQQYANLPSKLMTAMQREKKPFSYTLGAVGNNGILDLNQIKSPRMKRRLLANLRDGEDQNSKTNGSDYRTEAEQKAHAKALLAQNQTTTQALNDFNETLDSLSHHSAKKPTSPLALIGYTASSPPPLISPAPPVVAVRPQPQEVPRTPTDYDQQARVEDTDFSELDALTKKFDSTLSQARPAAPSPKPKPILSEIPRPPSFEKPSQFEKQHFRAQSVPPPMAPKLPEAARTGHTWRPSSQQQTPSSPHVQPTTPIYSPLSQNTMKPQTPPVQQNKPQSPPLYIPVADTSSIPTRNIPPETLLERQLSDLQNTTSRNATTPQSPQPQYVPVAYSIISGQQPSFPAQSAFENQMRELEAMASGFRPMTPPAWFGSSSPFNMMPFFSRQPDANPSPTSSEPFSFPTMKPPTLKRQNSIESQRLSSVYPNMSMNPNMMNPSQMFQMPFMMSNGTSFTTNPHSTPMNMVHVVGCNDQLPTSANILKIIRH